MGIGLDAIEARILAALQGHVRRGNPPTVNLEDVTRGSGADRLEAYERLQNHRTLVRRGLVARIADDIWELTREGEEFRVPTHPNMGEAPTTSGPAIGSGNTRVAPRVFVSYSHDSEAHRAWVTTLATRLRGAGIDALLDAWDLDLGMDLAKFMERGVAEVDRVLVVCTEIYVAKADAGRGGVGYEAMILTAELLQDLDTNKFVPVIRQSGKTVLPRALGTRRYVNFSDDSRFEASFEELVRALHDSPALPKPPLGSNPFASPALASAVPARGVPSPSPAPAPQGNADAVAHWSELLNQCKARREFVECDSPLRLDLERSTPQGRPATAEAQLAGFVSVGRVEARWFELGFPLAHQGGISMVTVPFSFVEDIWPGAEGRVHIRLSKTILFQRGKSTFV